MEKTRRAPEQIIRILRGSEGLSVDEAYRKHEISAPTCHRWNAKYGCMGNKEAQRLRDLHHYERPHHSLSLLTPKAYAKQLTWLSGPGRDTPSLHQIGDQPQPQETTNNQPLESPYYKWAKQLDSGTIMISVITTIQEPTDCVRELVKRLQTINGKLIVAGDTKGPPQFELENTEFLSIEKQIASGFSIVEKLPTKHYARKNVAYLQAIRAGAKVIYETDDDNRPNASWEMRSEYLDELLKVESPKGWVNIYKFFTEEHIWPRGLPLDQIKNPKPQTLRAKTALRCPIQQGLVNNSPDVDAIWRLTMDRPFHFNPSSHDSLFLSPGVWCPFNTQSTWWWPVAYPLLYIPSYCSFRMCDIWKSFIAQRCLWELEMGIAFHPPEVDQDRNPHDLNHDFNDEIPGYTLNQKIIEILESCKLEKGPSHVAGNLLRCYEELTQADIFPKEELELVTRWCHDLATLPPETNEAILTAKI